MSFLQHPLQNVLFAFFEKPLPRCASMMIHRIEFDENVVVRVFFVFEILLVVGKYGAPDSLFKWYLWPNFHPRGCRTLNIYGWSLLGIHSSHIYFFRKNAIKQFADCIVSYAATSSIFLNSQEEHQAQDLLYCTSFQLTKQWTPTAELLSLSLSLSLEIQIQVLWGRKTGESQCLYLS